MRIALALAPAFAIALALELAACSTPEPASAPIASGAPGSSGSPGAREPLSHVPSPSPLIGAALAGIERFGEITREQAGDFATALLGGEVVYGFRSGDPAIRDWELGGLGDLSALDLELATRVPLGHLDADGKLSRDVDFDRYTLFVAVGNSRYTVLVRPTRNPPVFEPVLDRAVTVVVSNEREPLQDVEARLVVTSCDSIGESYVVSRARTDAHGVAELAHAGFALQLAGQRRATLSIETGPAFGPGVRRELASLDDGPIRLRVGRTASVVVRTTPVPRFGWPTGSRLELVDAPAWHIDAAGARVRADRHGLSTELVVVPEQPPFGPLSVTRRADLPR
ncbi:MAG: hypothetical protein HZA52_17835 [Planctomycetes bacterium]|nr:hypothetical protein [Planctomycetota bacterium]